VDKERVYRCLDGAGRWTLGHAAGRSTQAPQERHRRRGGRGERQQRCGPQGQRPVARCPRDALRSFMYLDRDRTAAETIGRLRVYELRGRRRPEPFCRRVRTKKDGVAQAPQRDVDGDAVTDRCSQGASNLRSASRTGTCRVSQT